MVRVFVSFVDKANVVDRHVGRMSEGILEKNRGQSEGDRRSASRGNGEDQLAGGIQWIAESLTSVDSGQAMESDD